MQPTERKRPNALQMPVQSKRVRFVDLPSQDKTALEQDTSPKRSRTLLNIAPRASVLEPYVSSINRDGHSMVDASIGERDEPIRSVPRPEIIDLMEETPPPDGEPSTRMADPKLGQQVDPLLHIRSYKRETLPIEMKLSGAQAPDASVTMQSLFEKIYSILLPPSGQIHTLEAAIIEKAGSGASTSKGAGTKTLDRMKICHVVDTTFETFLALVQEHQELFHSDRAYITLTVVAVCSKPDSHPIAET